MHPLLLRCAFPEGPLQCAVSGGPDSLALLFLAAQTGQRVRALYVDHGIRPDSAADADVVRRAAAAVGADAAVLTVDVSPGPNLEARAREARYAALPVGVCTGHTADDLAETMLANLLRGTGLDGLSPLRHPDRKRPMLGLRRFETLALCAELGWKPIDDPMNADPRFLRSRIRHEVLPLLNVVADRDVVPQLQRLSALASDETALLDELARAIDPTDARQLRDAPLPLARRAIRSWLHNQLSVAPTAGAIERVLTVAAGEAVACEVEGGIRIARRHQRLYLTSGHDELPS
jgi:tRNA(Ile)-lysidine synthase